MNNTSSGEQATCRHSLLVACLLTFIVTFFVSLGFFLVFSKYMRITRRKEDRIPRMESFPQLTDYTRNTHTNDPSMSTIKQQRREDKIVQQRQTTLHSLNRNSPLNRTIATTTPRKYLDSRASAGTCSQTSRNVSSYRKFATPPISPLAPNISLTPKQPCTPIRGPGIQHSPMFTFQRDSDGRPSPGTMVPMGISSKTRRVKKYTEVTEERLKMPHLLCDINEKIARNTRELESIPEPSDVSIIESHNTELSTSVYTAPHAICKDCRTLDYKNSPERITQIFHHLASDMLNDNFTMFLKRLPKMKCVARSKLEYIKYAYKQSTRDQVYQTLLAWAESFPEEATFETIITEMYRYFDSTDTVFKMYLLFCPNKSQV